MKIKIWTALHTGSRIPQLWGFRVTNLATDPLIDKQMLTEVERILRSQSLHNSETLKRLLKFLGEKSAVGEADQLKEYTIAVDALERPSTYDPRHDSAVRIQISRLRQKLAEYYRTEGKDNPLVIDLPKGHFKLTCGPRAPIIQPAASSAKTNAERTRTLVAAFLLLTLTFAVAWGGYSIIKIRNAEAMSSAIDTRWTPDLEELWRPFLVTNRPMLVAIEDPLFVELQRGSGIYYRDKSFDEWNGALGSPGVRALRKQFKDPNMQPSRYYTSFGEVNAAFLIGRLLGAKESNLSVVKTSQLSWQQLADNNVVFVGVRAFFDGPLRSMPLQPELVSVSKGIQNLKPRPGEPEMFSDRFSTAPTEEGEIYALVTHLPGPVGGSDVESFMSNRAAGYVGAVQCFTDANFAKNLVANLKNAYGRIPRYYQVVLKVQFKDEVPTKTSFVLSRKLG